MGVFVDSNSDLYSTSVIAVLYAISRYIGPRYNNTQLYFEDGDKIALRFHHIVPIVKLNCFALTFLLLEWILLVMLN